MTDRDLKPFICWFPYDGTQFGFEIYARDFADAERRIQRIGTHGKVDGELMAVIPASRGGFLVPMVCWVRNLFVRPSRQP